MGLGQASWVDAAKSESRGWDSAEIFIKANSSLSPPRQELSIKVLELISTIWDSELHIASLRLLNNLPLPDFAHPQLRRVMPALMEILQSDYILAQVPQHHGPRSVYLTALDQHLEGGEKICVFSAQAETHLPSHALLFPLFRCKSFDC